ncbi:F0F1 ATP synthase subunit B family protein [Brevundimonas balnearis]|uniref:ATP synthase subunit b n=1 Tax=Brevundimonas balnearis TaxID=1572858 RepID=A0ABV6R6M9_9CAUL
MASPAPTDPHGETHASTEAASGGLPQFDTTVWAGQIAYLLILFVLMLILVSKVFAPRMRRVWDERAATIRGAVETARSVQEQAAQQAAAAKAEVEAARAEARATAAAARARVAEQAAARTAAQEAELNARIAAAEAEIAKTRDGALASVGAVAADTAAAMVAKLTGKAPTAAEMKGTA